MKGASRVMGQLFVWDTREFGMPARTVGSDMRCWIAGCMIVRWKGQWGLGVGELEGGC